MIEQPLTAAFDVFPNGLPGRLRITLAQGLNDPEVRVRIPVTRDPRIIKVRQDRAAAHPEAFDHFVHDRKAAQATKLQMKLGVQVNGSIEFFALMALGDAIMNGRQSIDFFFGRQFRRSGGPAALQVDPDRPDFEKLIQGQPWNHYGSAPIQR